MGTVRAGASLAVMATAFLLAPATASATTSCTYTGAPFDLVQVALQGGDQLKLRTSGTAIVVNNGSNDLTCSGGNPTLSNTKTISVASQTGGTPNIAEIDGPGRFGDAGIETFVNLHDVAGSALFVVATAASGESIHYGSNGIGASNSGGDPAVTLTPNGVPRLEFFGGPGPDVIDAQGGSLTGAPRTDPVHVRGGAGIDSLGGGDGDDSISGDDGSDNIFGFAGNDTIDPGAGDDAPVDGGDGIDALSFQDSPAGVQVDLALSNIRQNTGPEGSDAFARIENVIGSELNDDLRGDGGPNLLDGFAGNDTIEGRGGTDDLRGGANDDTILARDGEADAVACGSENDTVTTDLPGVDTLTGCETALFPPVQSGGGTGSPGGGGTTTGTTATRDDRDRAARTGGRLAAAPGNRGRGRHAGAVVRRLAARRPVAVPGRPAGPARGRGIRGSPRHDLPLRAVRGGKGDVRDRTQAARPLPPRQAPVRSVQARRRLRRRGRRRPERPAVLRPDRSPNARAGRLPCAGDRDRRHRQPVCRGHRALHRAARLRAIRWIVSSAPPSAVAPAGVHAGARRGTRQAAASLRPRARSRRRSPAGSRPP